MDREQRLAAAKKKLNIYKQQQQQQARRPSNSGEPSTPSSSSSSNAGQISPAIQAPNSSGSNQSNGNHSNEPVIADRVRFMQNEEAPQHFPVDIGVDRVEPSPPLQPLIPLALPLLLDGPPQQLDLLDSNSLQPHPTAHFDLLDSNTLPHHSLAQSSPAPSSSTGTNAIAGRDIVETHQHQHQRQAGSGSNAGHIFNHDIVADINTSYNFNNDNGLMAFANSGSSGLPDVASDAPAPVAVTPGLIEDNQPSSPTQREMEQDIVNRVNQQSADVAPVSPPDNDLVATATVSALNHDHHDHEHVHLFDHHTQAVEPSTSATARANSGSRNPNPVNLYPTPTFRRAHQSGGGSASSSVSGHSGGGVDDLNSMNAAASAITTEVYELQLSQLRADNLHLQQREADLVTQLQHVELTMQTLRKERDELKQELRAEDTPSLKSKLSTVYDENAKLKAQVRSLELQLESANENVKIKVDSYNELEQALIVINKGKMELAAKLDVESEIGKELRDRFEESQHQLAKLRERNIELESILSSHQLQLERLSSLEAEMVQMKRTYNETGASAINHYDHGHKHEHENLHDHSDEHHFEHHHNHSHDHDHGSEHHHDVEEGHHHEHHAECDHDHDHHGHSHGAQHDRSHSHDDHGHSHDHEHDHDHDHSHDHEHEHDHEDEDGHKEHHMHAKHLHEDPKSMSAMEKKLARLEWENKSFREEIDRLADLLRAKTVDANLLTNYQEDNERLKRNLNQAEHLVVQLSSENETIGDYIALYQTQRLALKERAREKENELATLSIEREKLRSQMEQLNQLLQSYHCKLEEGTAAGEIETNAKQINDLVLGINSTFHPCSVCSGSRLMNV